MRYFTRYLKKLYYYVTRVTCNALPPTLFISMYVFNKNADVCFAQTALLISTVVH